MASSLARFASTQRLDGGPVYSDGEDEDEAEWDGVEEEEEVDEGIQIDEDPARATAEANTNAVEIREIGRASCRERV